MSEQISVATRALPCNSPDAIPRMQAPDHKNILSSHRENMRGNQRHIDRYPSLKVLFSNQNTIFAQYDQIAQILIFPFIFKSVRFLHSLFGLGLG